MTFAADADAVAVMETLAMTVPASVEERACAAAKLSADPALLAKVRGGVAQGSVEFDAVATLVELCRRESFGRSTAASVAASHPGMSSEQQQCVQDKFVALSETDVNALVVAAVTPQGSLAGQGQAVMAKLLSDCGVAG